MVDEHTPVYGRDDPEIEASVGKRFVIALGANPTTGYSWEAEVDDAQVLLVDERFESADDRVGSGGVQRFVLEPVAKGRTTIVLRHRRSWEPGETERLVFELSAS